MKNRGAWPPKSTCGPGVTIFLIIFRCPTPRAQTSTGYRGAQGVMPHVPHKPPSVTTCHTPWASDSPHPRPHRRGLCAASTELGLTISADGTGGGGDRLCWWRSRGRIPGGGHQTASGSLADGVGVGGEPRPCRERERSLGRYRWRERRWNVMEGLEILG